MNDAGRRTTALLVKNGIPFDVAECLPEAERDAYCIIFGELDGGEWDWNRNRWVTKDR